MLGNLQLVQPSNMMKYVTFFLLSQAEKLSLFDKDPSCANPRAFMVLCELI